MGLLSPKSQAHPANLREKQKHRKQNMGPADKMWPENIRAAQCCVGTRPKRFSFIRQFSPLSKFTSSSRWNDQAQLTVEIGQYSVWANSGERSFSNHTNYCTLSFLITLLVGAVNEPVHLPRLVLEAEASQVMLSLKHIRGYDSDNLFRWNINNVSRVPSGSPIIHPSISFFYMLSCTISLLIPHVSSSSW